MENYRCRDCQAFFVDAAVQVRCLGCGQIHLPEQLRVREVYDYQLTESGRMRCRQGLGGGKFDIDAHFDFQGLIKREPFMLLLGWMLDIERRYKRAVFSIVGIRLANLKDVLKQMGERRGYALLDSVVGRLAEVIRDSDRCTRTAEDIIWLLLPETDAKGAQSVVERLNVLAEVLNEVDTGIQVRITHYSAPDDIHSEDDPELFLTRQASQLF
jgi:GGDEF domain-containing protein